MQELKLDLFKVHKGGCFFQLDLSLEPTLSTNVSYMCILGATGIKIAQRTQRTPLFIRTAIHNYVHLRIPRNSNGQVQCYIKVASVMTCRDR